MRTKEIIAILYGGKSGEHEVSLRSAYSVFTHIDTAIYEPLLIGIDRNGRWYLQTDSNPVGEPESLRIDIREANRVGAFPGEGLFAGQNKLEIDCVFPVLHGTNGEDGTIQGLLELCGLPYVGAGVLGSSLSMNKGAAKEMWSARGLPVVPFIRINREEYDSSSDMRRRLLKNTLERFAPPLFIKPARAGSSVGVSRVDHGEELEAAINEAFRFDTEVLAEPAIAGREIECSVVGNFFTHSFTPGEILPSHGFYDYTAKYIDPDGAALQLPADMNEEKHTEIRRIAEEAFAAVEAQGMARVDFFVEKDSGRVLLNEINTIPGFTSISMFPRMCEAGGLAYPQLIGQLIELAKARSKIQEASSDYQWL